MVLLHYRVNAETSPYTKTLDLNFLIGKDLISEGEDILILDRILYQSFLGFKIPPPEATVYASEICGSINQKLTSDRNMVFLAIKIHSNDVVSIVKLEVTESKSLIKSLSAELFN